MITWNNPSISLQAEYPKILRLSLIVTLVMISAVLVTVPGMPEKKLRLPNRW